MYYECYRKEPLHYPLIKKQKAANKQKRRVLKGPNTIVQIIEPLKGWYQITCHVHCLRRRCVYNVNVLIICVSFTQYKKRIWIFTFENHVHNVVLQRSYGSCLWFSDLELNARKIACFYVQLSLSNQLNQKLRKFYFAPRKIMSKLSGFFLKKIC